MASSDDLKKDLQKAISSVGGYVAAREEQINELIDKTAGKVDERTDKRYSGTIDKLVAGLHTGVAKLAEQKAEEGEESEEPPTGPSGDDEPLS